MHGSFVHIIRESIFSLIENMKVNSERIVKSYIGNANNIKFNRNDYITGFSKVHLKFYLFLRVLIR